MKYIIDFNERRAIRRQAINDCLHDKFPTLDSIKFFVRLWEREAWSYELRLY